MRHKNSVLRTAALIPGTLYIHLDLLVFIDSFFFCCHVYTVLLRGEVSCDAVPPRQFFVLSSRVGQAAERAYASD